MANLMSKLSKPISTASEYIGSKFQRKPAKEVPITKMASRKEQGDNKLREWFWGLVIAASCGLGGWALNSTVDLYASMREEKALRTSSYENMDKRIEALKQDMQKNIDDARSDADKRLADYKAESERHSREVRMETDRRFGEIQKQLELLNNKLDKLLIRPAP